VALVVLGCFWVVVGGSVWICRVLGGSGVVLGWFWGDSRVALGWFWDCSGMVLGMILECFWIVLKDSGWFWGGSGVVLGWFWDGSGVVLGGSALFRAVLCGSELVLNGHVVLGACGWLWWFWGASGWF
jgi:hypothetical protein